MWVAGRRFHRERNPLAAVAGTAGGEAVTINRDDVADARKRGLPPSAPRDVKIAALVAAAGNTQRDAEKVLSALHKLGWTVRPLRCGNGGGNTSNRDIDSLRNLAKQGFISKLGA